MINCQCHATAYLRHFYLHISWFILKVLCHYFFCTITSSNPFKTIYVFLINNNWKGQPMVISGYISKHLAPALLRYLSYYMPPVSMDPWAAIKQSLH